MHFNLPPADPGVAESPASGSLFASAPSAGASKRPSFSFDPARPDFAPYGLTCVRWQPSAMGRPDHHNEVELNFLRSGSLTYLFGGRKCIVRAGGLTVFWAAIPHQVIGFDSTASYFVATIPLPWFLQWRLPERFVHTLLQGQIVQDFTGDAASDRAALIQWEQDLATRTAEVEHAVLLEMQARLLRVAAGLPSESHVMRPTATDAIPLDASLNKMEQMACFIAQSYTHRLNVRAIARVVNLHPNYAMNAFQRRFGTTLLSYLTQHRVSHAERLLATTTLTVAEVAFRSGFSSISRFNDAFRRVCGCSPRTYRRSHLLQNFVTRSRARSRERG